MGAEYIGANHKPPVRVEKTVFLHGMRPPVGNVGVGRKRVAHPYYIAAFGVQLPECMIGYVERGEFSSELQGERLPVVIYALAHAVV